jgi:hypothetical protein
MRTRLPFATALATALALTLVAGAAHATPDLAVSVTQPAGTSYVYSSVRYTVKVRNVGSPFTQPTTLSIDLPDTNTSPQVYPLGTVGAMTNGCTRSGLRITCPVGRLNPGQTAQFYFYMNIPEAWQPVSFTAAVQPVGADAQSYNNQQTFVPVLANPPHAIALTAPVTVTNDHCTGTNLQSYYECTLFPSSISRHSVLFHPNGTITIPDAGPSYGGTWSQPTPDSLVFQYTDGGSPIANFEGYGVGNRTFVPSSTYSSPYRVCLP